MTSKNGEIWQPLSKLGLIVQAGDVINVAGEILRRRADVDKPAVCIDSISARLGT
jgi:hypothetical protein